MLKYEALDDFDNVFAFKHMLRAARKCVLGVGWKSSVQSFKAAMGLKVYRVFKRIRDTHRYKTKGFACVFDITERGHARHIMSLSVEERMVQDTLRRYCLAPLLQSSFVYDNYACQEGKGYHLAIRRLRKHLSDHFRRHSRTGAILIYDFKGYFDSISHALAMKLIDDKISDADIRNMARQFVDAFGGDKGLGLGSTISQPLALAAANGLDHKIREMARCGRSGRYMDDGWAIHESKEYLHKVLASIRRYAESLGLHLSEKKTMIIDLRHPFVILKKRFHLLESGKVLAKICRSSIARERRKLKKCKDKFLAGKMNDKEIYQAYQSWESYARHGNAWHTIQNMRRLYMRLFVDIPQDPDFVAWCDVPQEAA